MSHKILLNNYTARMLHLLYFLLLNITSLSSREITADQVRWNKLY